MYMAACCLSSVRLFVCNFAQTFFGVLDILCFSVIFLVLCDILLTKFYIYFYDFQL